MEEKSQSIKDRIKQKNSGSGVKLKVKKKIFKKPVSVASQTKVSPFY